MQMLLEEGTICIINPKDKEPHVEVGCEHDVHFQHGEVKIIDDSVSVAFVFRVSPHTCVCDLITNHVIHEKEDIAAIAIKELKGPVKDSDRQKLYNEFDKEFYKQLFTEKFNKVFNI